jgi:hypothetical protein
VDPLIFDSEADREALLNALTPRALITCRVSVSKLIDLRTPLDRAQAGLTLSDLQFATNDSEAYTRCKRVARVAHQLRRHEIAAAAADEGGETLVLFMDVLPAEERPRRSRDDDLWQRLPEDPRRLTRRHLRVVDGARRGDEE